jgi:hypothetical protein
MRGSRYIGDGGDAIAAFLSRFFFDFDDGSLSRFRFFVRRFLLLPPAPFPAGEAVLAREVIFCIA